MPRSKETIQPELPGFEKSDQIKRAQRRALDPPKESKETTQLYQFPEGTPLYLKGHYAFCVALHSFQAIKIKGRKVSGLAAFELSEQLSMKIIAGKNKGKESWINPGKIFGAYTSSGDYRPKKLK